MIAEDRYKNEIMVVDDIPDNVKLLYDLLNRKEYVVRPFSNSTFALKSALTNPPSLILLDIYMPELDGFEFCRILKENEETADIPIIFISALTDTENKIKAFKAGGVDYITKPFQEDEVFSRVHTHLDLYYTKKHLEELVNIRTLELHHSHSQLNDSHSQLLKAQQIAHIGSWVLNFKTKALDWSDEIYSIFGVEPQKFASTYEAFLEFIHPDDRELVNSEFNRSVKEHTPYDIIHRLLLKNGTVKYVNERCETTYDDSGNPVHSIGTVHDITKLKKAEEERERFMSAIEQSQDTVVITDIKGNIEYINNSFCNITGYTKQDVIGKNTRLLKSGEHDEAIYKELWNTLTNKNIWKGRIINKKKDGSHFTEDISISPVLDHSGTIINYVAVMRDITKQLQIEKEKKRMEQMMIQNEKMLSIGGLAAGMAHEINNPISGMIMSADLIKRQLCDNLNTPTILAAAEKTGISLDSIRNFIDSIGIRKLFDVIHDSGKRVTTIMNNMLSFSRKSEGYKSLNDFTKLIENVIEIAKTDINLKNKYSFKYIEIKKEYEENLPFIMCERVNIQQVILNLLRNGAQAMQENRTETPQFIIYLYCDEKREIVTVEIEDNGLGMTKEVSQHVFEPFFTTKAEGIGTGLGLSISYFIITTNHKGLLSVESKTGVGTKFIIQLPIK